MNINRKNPSPRFRRRYPGYRPQQPRLPDSSKAKRGHYDIVVLNHKYIQTHGAETVKNLNYKAARNKAIQPFEAIVEFRLDDRDWSAGKTRGAIAELGKLKLSDKEVGLRYFVPLMRYTAPNMNRWNKYWPQVGQAAKENNEIRSVFATRWLSVDQKTTTSKFGGRRIEF